MKFITIILLTVSLSSANIWKELKPIASYKSTDYRLNSNIAYIELRRYQKYIKSGSNMDKSFNSNIYIKVLQIGEQPKISSNQLRRFNSIKGDFGDISNIRKDSMSLMSGCSCNIVNAFMIDKNSKMWRLNEVKDIVNSIKPIDTPAEIRLIIWLHYIKFDKSKIRYKKIEDGFDILLEYENSLLNRGECGKFGYKFTIDKSGKVLNMHQIYKAKSDDCITVD